MPICAFKLVSYSAHILVPWHIPIIWGLLYMLPVVLFGLLAVFVLIMIQTQVDFVFLCSPTSSLGLWLHYMGQAVYIITTFTSIYHLYLDAA